MKMVYPEWRGKAGELPPDVQMAVGVVLGAAAFHPSLEGLLIHVAMLMRRRSRNERRRVARLLISSRDTSIGAP